MRQTRKHMVGKKWAQIQSYAKPYVSKNSGKKDKRVNDEGSSWLWNVRQIHRV